jgi:hypothetical protein
MASVAFAEKPGITVTDKISKSRGNAMDGIKRKDAINEVGKAPKAPANKGGEKGRGFAAGINVDNWTGLYIKIYINDICEGTVSPWGDLFIVVGSGRTKFYGVAEYSDGSTGTFGPHIETIDGLATWKLNN